MTVSKKRKPSLGQLMKQIPAIQAETAALCQSEIACAVADAWINSLESSAVRRLRWRVELGNDLVDALDRLEEVTRTSELRKVRP